MFYCRVQSLYSSAVRNVTYFFGNFTDESFTYLTSGYAVITWIPKLTLVLIFVINLRNYVVNQLSLRLLLCRVSYCLCDRNNPVNINVLERRVISGCGRGWVF
jgi:hypothetical protein